MRSSVGRFWCVDAHWAFKSRRRGAGTRGPHVPKASVGDADGSEEVGAAVGVLVVGNLVGVTDGNAEGLSVGSPVGCAVGSELGCAVGTIVGLWVGLAVGLSVGRAVGNPVG